MQNYIFVNFILIIKNMSKNYLLFFNYLLGSINPCSENV